MNKDAFLDFAKIAVVSAFLPLLSALITDQIAYNSLVSFLIYSFFTYYCLLKKSSQTFSRLLIISAIVFGRCILDLDVIVGYLAGEIWSLPLFSITLFAITCGYLYWKKPKVGIAFFLIGLLFVGFMLSKGWDLWFHKRNFGTFTGKTAPHKLTFTFAAFDQTNSIINSTYFEKKIVLLDFWTTTCNVCFKKFPTLQKTFDRYKNDKEVILVAVNIPFAEDEPDKVFDMIKKQSYNFPVVIAKDADLAERFGIKGYPTTFVINQNSQIVYKGDIEGAIKMVDELRASSQ